jgi:hypothetical protein
MTLDAALPQRSSLSSFPAISPTTLDGTAIISPFTDPVSLSSNISPSLTSGFNTSTNKSSSIQTFDASRTSASLASATLSSSNEKSGLSIIQTAGLAIGCIAVGAALAVLAACMLVHRRRRSKDASARASCSKPSISTNSVDEKSSPIIMKHIERSPSCKTLETLLARPSSDDNLIAMFVQLNASIADYAQKCISIEHRLQLPADEFLSVQTLEDLLGPDSPVNARDMAALLQHDQTRAAGVRHMIAWSILQNIEVQTLLRLHCFRPRFRNVCPR